MSGIKCCQNNKQRIKLIDCRSLRLWFRIGHSRENSICIRQHFCHWANKKNIKLKNCASENRKWKFITWWCSWKHRKKIGGRSLCYFSCYNIRNKMKVSFICKQIINSILCLIFDSLLHWCSNRGFNHKATEFDGQSQVKDTQTINNCVSIART